MHLIWYNVLSKNYECGESAVYGGLLSGSAMSSNLNVLMEFPENEKDLALKTIANLNNAKVEKNK